MGDLSNLIPVDPDVPYKSVLEAILFLLLTNDIPLHTFNPIHFTVDYITFGC